jgi:hypothetical protein
MIQNKSNDENIKPKSHKAKKVKKTDVVVLKSIVKIEYGKFTVSFGD